MSDAHEMDLFEPDAAEVDFVPVETAAPARSRAEVFGTGGVGQGGLCERNAPRKAVQTENRLSMGWTAHAYDDGAEGGPVSTSGTSIFDPVLTELAYRWFCPPGGHVLDPFAGGSVRGIVAAALGYRYTGIDLRPEQLAANRQQAAAIVPDALRIPVKISAEMARQQFRPCETGFIRDVCRAACCDAPTRPGGLLVTIHASETAAIEKHGGVVNGGFLAPRNGTPGCPFKTADALCGLHVTPDKPFGCIASPFTLTEKDTLIVRNRYRLLKCYKADGALPAYKAHAAAFERILGHAEALRVTEWLDSGGGDIEAFVAPDVYKRLKDNDDAKRGTESDRGTGRLRWIEGDSRNVQTLAPGAYDFVFSCPPYADLERYSDDPRDLSTMDYPAFRAALGEIVAASCALLKKDRFACFVVGDVRGKDGLYRGLPHDTVAAFRAAGLGLYNEAVLVTQVGSLPIRVTKQFESGRKLGKTHQNVLVFVRGDWRRAAAACNAEVSP